MAKQTINIGASPNDGTGTPLRTAFDYTNQNFTELYTATGPSGNNIVVPGSATITGDLTVDTSTLKVDSANDRVGIKNASPTYTLDVTGTANDVAIGTRLAYGTAGEVYSAFRFNNTSFAGGNSEIRNIVNGSSTTGSSLAFFTTQQGGSTLTERYRLDTNGVATWSNVGGVAGTAMTLNSSGLGVGEAASVSRLQPRGSTSDSSAYILYGKASSGNVICFMRNDGRFLVGNGTTDNFIVTETGNVGVGVTPSAWNTAFRGIDISTGGAIAGSSDSVRLFSNSAFNTAGNNVYKNAAAAGRYDIQGNVHTWNISTNTPSAGGTITFSPAMTLDPSGNLVIGNTAASNVGATGGLVSVPNSGNSYHLIGHTTGTASGSNFTYYFYAGSVIGSITQNGTTGVLFNTSSDYRLKESVKPLSGGLARVNALKPSSYNWKSDGSAGEGFLAHELAEVVPTAVSGEKDAVNADGTIKSQGIDMSRIVPILVAAIQELTAEVNALKNA
jgi:hypothetical protein